MKTTKARRPRLNWKLSLLLMLIGGELMIGCRSEPRVYQGKVAGSGSPQVPTSGAPAGFPDARNQAQRAVRHNPRMSTADKEAALRNLGQKPR